MKTSFRTTASVIAVTVAALAAPSLAHAKRMGGGKSVRPAAINKAPPSLQPLQRLRQQQHPLQPRLQPLPHLPLHPWQPHVLQAQA